MIAIQLLQVLIPTNPSNMEYRPPCLYNISNLDAKLSSYITFYPRGSSLEVRIRGYRGVLSSICGQSLGLQVPRYANKAERNTCWEYGAVYPTGSLVVAV